MLQNPCKTLGFKKNMVYKIPPEGEVNHIQPVTLAVFSTSLALPGIMFIIEKMFLSETRRPKALIFDM